MSDVSAKSAFDADGHPKPSIDKRLLEFVTLLDGVVGARHTFRVEYNSLRDFEIQFTDRDLQDRAYNKLHVTLDDQGQYAVTHTGAMDFSALSNMNARAARMAINGWIDVLQKTYHFDCQSNLHRRRCERAEMLGVKKLTF
ncbi:hypothetical protein [Micavibrio aeruginosavorus]|uniref:Uncharacterized protein n=1 Tax=Micavibrio aeruginosavorus (strain ARL-13) TaxID=856793 RepID=G2KM52_MICAA|nr:hypothetical protein [Micavibrio aeruginosavorus]AEP09748.1 hypothetical protein MICA_1430 [Micavibrio aeruginosavorus ARL-13]